MGKDHTSVCLEPMNKYQGHTESMGENEERKKGQIFKRNTVNGKSFVWI